MSSSIKTGRVVRGVGGVRRIALFAGGMVAGMLLYFIIPRYAGKPGRANESRSRELSRLRRHILGSDRHAVTRALGPPRTAALADEARHDETWYYAIGPRAALAIRFHGPIARRVEFFAVPGAPQST